ncbi:MAG TPA: GGDEF domain-containing protein [Polyangiaceae bacterium]
MTNPNTLEDWKLRCERLEQQLSERNDAIAYLQRVSSDTATRSLRRSLDLIAMIAERDRFVSEVERLLVEKGRLVDQLSALNTQLTSMVNTDALTGANNRRRIVDVLEEEIRRHQRYRTMVSAILFDIDHFKLFNDNYGHAVGDEVLVHVSSLVRRNIRSVDSFGRYGGEEFLIVLPETGLENGRIVAQKLRAIIRDTPLDARKHELRVTASFGVVELLGVDTLESMIKRADFAMYESKSHGRDRVTMATLRLSSAPSSPEDSSSSRIKCIAG